jgi:ATP-dependent RNA circularization protein (DNA/RNA ligase family)
MDFAKPNSPMRKRNMEDDDPIEELEMANRDGVVITSNSNKGKTIEFTSHDENNGKYFAKKKKKNQEC